MEQACYLETECGGVWIPRFVTILGWGAGIPLSHEDPQDTAGLPASHCGTLRAAFSRRPGVHCQNGCPRTT